jgi:hypothetical protein
MGSPTQAPPWQELMELHALSSEHGLPFGARLIAQVPSAGTQLLTRQASAGGGQVIVVPARGAHLPSTHPTRPLQKFPSSNELQSLLLSHSGQKSSPEAQVPP